MIPEKKSESIINFLPPKVKKAIAGGMVAAGLATGCNVLVEALPPERPVEVSTGIPDKEPEKNVDPTQADYEIIPTEKATETVINPPNITPESTLAVEVSEDELRIQQTVEDFLNKVGNYTDEKIAELGFNLPEMDEQGLGLVVSSEEGYFLGQYIFFDAKADENNQEGYYLMGGIDKNKERFVFVAKQKYVFDDDIPGVIVHFSKSRIKISGETGPNNFNITSTEELLKLRDLYASKPVIMNFTYDASEMAYLPEDIINILSDFLNQNQAEGKDLLNRSYSLNKHITNQNILSGNFQYVLTEDNNFSITEWLKFTGTAPVMSTVVVIEDLSD